MYYANPNSSCLVEEDEEHTHALDSDAKNIVLLISSALESKIFSEIHVMRKTVIDGSNYNRISENHAGCTRRKH